MHVHLCHTNTKDYEIRDKQIKLCKCNKLVGGPVEAPALPLSDNNCTHQRPTAALLAGAVPAQLQTQSPA